MSQVYATPMEAVAVSPHGWAQLPSGIWVTKIPLIDTSHEGLFARVNYSEGMWFGAHEYGARLIAPSTVVELVQHGFWTTPQILPDAAQRAALPRFQGETHDAYEVRIRQDMASLAWAERHDQKVWAELATWDGVLPTMNVGKWWVYLEGLDANKDGQNQEDDWCHLFGWAKSKASRSLSSSALTEWWQPLYVHSHKGRHQRDYGTLVMLESDTLPEAA